MKVRLCVNCGEAYALTPNKPGYINECADCGADHEVALTEIPDHLMAVCSDVTGDQIAEMRR